MLRLPHSLPAPADATMSPTRLSAVFLIFIAVHASGGVKAVAGVMPTAASTQGSPATPADEVDRIFAEFTRDTPGCAVGLSRDEATVLLRGYGRASLEHDVPLTPDSVFEAGSVSKQFTAAAVLLLERDGLLRLDDAVHRHIPELPRSDPPITIRQMLQHTSGLRDWGVLAGIAGWPRTTRVHSHRHVLDIVARQTATNFAAGTRWSYTNTGYNLAAILVARVSGQSFAAFTRTRLFEPLGMTRTSWRDDHRTVVQGRAVAYQASDGGFKTAMPFEDAHGNGGLLTTVGDLLIWARHLQRASVDKGSSWLLTLQQPISFSGQRGAGYGLGLELGARRGLRQVDHSGSTAGYQAHLATYPEQRIAVAVLCNVRSANPTLLAYAAADIFLASRAKLLSGPQELIRPSADALDALAGLYRSTQNGRAVRVARDGDALVVDGRGRLLAQSSMQFVTQYGQAWSFDGFGGLRVSDHVAEESFSRVLQASPTEAELLALTGRYVNPEVETELTVRMVGPTLVIDRRPDSRFELRPLYGDAFNAGSLGTVVFRRGAGGEVTSMSIVDSRVWNLRFERHRAGQLQ